MFENYKDRDTIYEEIATEIKERFGDIVEDSIINQICNIIATKLSEIYDYLDSINPEFYVTTASSEYLDRIGSNVGVIRQEDEDDDNYRFRIENNSIIRVSSTHLAQRINTIVNNNVRDVLIKENYFGPGSVLALVLTYDGILTDDIRQAAINTINSYTNIGTKIVVRGPEVIKVDIEIITYYLPETSQESINYSNNAIRERIIEYIANLRIGEGILINTIKRIILESGLPVDTYNIASFRVDGNPVLLADFTPQWDQKLVAGEIIVR